MRMEDQEESQNIEDARGSSGGGFQFRPGSSAVLSRVTRSAATLSMPRQCRVSQCAAGFGISRPRKWTSSPISAIAQTMTGLEGRSNTADDTRPIT